MSLPFHLGLRYNRHLLTLVKLGDRPGRVLGVGHPEDDDRRARIPLQWGQATQSPRRTEPATVDLPLPLRTRTILSYEVNERVRAELDSGVEPQVQSRRDTEAGPKQHLHRGTDHAGLPVEARVRYSAMQPDLPATPPRRGRHADD